MLGLRLFKVWGKSECTPGLTLVFTKVTLGFWMGNLAGPRLFGCFKLLRHEALFHMAQSGTWFKENRFAFIFQTHISGGVSFLSTPDYGRFHSVFPAQAS